MISRRRFVAEILPVSLLGLVSLRVQAASPSDADPSAWVVGMMNQVLADIRKDPALKKEDPARIRTFVSNRILPVVDFPRMTRTAVGPRWRQASADQRRQLEDGFRNLLTRVYSGAFSGVKDYRAELVPSRGAAGATPIVRTRLVSKTEKPVDVGYRLAKGANGWQIIDVNVSGIWLVQNYHSQFGSILANGGIPALIASMNDKNSALNHKQ
ncbi:ABC transporter substrate-binding protein [Mesosutterella sp. OilRF-GAM-744-9]|uniref:ABC transporter substrate-binding protein n=2 Tax=Mesosutterella porci TaxID=2915351 RepID=A0ABS9MR25_9BURK|nr:ABC transporter substrate-binding protein [Mesosutterella sp. oilRF-744-WT-GAM-9]